MQFEAIPNLFGKEQSFTYLGPKSPCSKLFQYSLEFFCNFFTLRCDPVSNQIIPPCKEMCFDYLYACQSELQNGGIIDCNYLPSLKEDFPCFYKPATCRELPPTVTNAKVTSDFTVEGKYFFPGFAEYSCNEGFRMEGNKTISCSSDGQWSIPPRCTLGDINIMKLPQSFPKENSTSITYRTETKGDPTTTQKAEFIIEYTKNFTTYDYATIQTAEFITESTSVPTKKLTFNNNTMHSLESTAKANIQINESTGTSTTHFLIVVCLLIVMVILFVLTAVRYKMKFKKRDRKDPEKSLHTASPLKRKRTFDATIFYHFDSDDDFVINHLLPELEERRNFKICIHSRLYTRTRHQR